MKINLSSSLRTFQSVVTANSPILLVGTAIVGVVATGVLAARGGYKARGIIDEERMRRVAAPEPPFDTYLEHHEAYIKMADPLTLQDKVKLTWLCYAAPALTGASTIACTVGVHTIHTKRHAALAGVLAVTTTKLDDYKEEAEKLLGVKKSQQVTDSVAQKAVDRNGSFDNNEVILTGHGNELCRDELSGQWFTGSLNKIEAAVLSVNKKLLEEGSATLNEFYDELGLPPNGMGENFGWSGITLETRTGSVMASDGRPAISVSFHQEPEENCGLRK